MAYFMVHINVAQKLYDRLPEIKDKGAFYLGVIHCVQRRQEARR